MVYGGFSQTPWVQVPQLPVFRFSSFSAGWIPINVRISVFLLVMAVCFLSVTLFGVWFLVLVLPWWCFVGRPKLLSTAPESLTCTENIIM